MEDKGKYFFRNDDSPEEEPREDSIVDPETGANESSELMTEEKLEQFYGGQGQDYLDLNMADRADETEESLSSASSFQTEPQEENRDLTPKEMDMPTTTEENWYNMKINGADQSGNQHKRKHGVRKKIFAVAGSLVAVVLIAFSSIGVYTLFFEDQGDAQDIPESEGTIVQQTASEEGLTIAEIAAKVTPSVVGILVESSEGSGSGTGIVLTEDGYIITNAHVVAGMSKVTVVLMDETEYDATVVGYDSQTDLAVLKIDANNLTPAEFGDSDELVIGDEVVAIGNPLGMDFAGSVANGIVSGLDREVEIGGQVMTYIQTNASINSGNSGGPLVNSSGQVIGINSAKISSTVAEGMGFAIPINDAIPIIEELKENGSIAGRPQIGIGGEDLDEETAAFYNVPPGVLVQQVYDGSGAATAGIRQGDIITAINGTEISSIARLNEIKNEFAPGDEIELTIYRDGRYATVNVVLSEQDSQ